MLVAQQTLLCLEGKLPAFGCCPATAIPADCCDKLCRRLSASLHLPLLQRQSCCATDAILAKKYYHFIRVMGRAASHIALECALQTRPQTAFISEEVAAKKLGLGDITNQVDAGLARAQPVVNWGIQGARRMPVTQRPQQQAQQTAPCSHMLDTGANKVTCCLRMLWIGTPVHTAILP